MGRYSIYHSPFIYHSGLAETYLSGDKMKNESDEISSTLSGTHNLSRGFLSNKINFLNHISKSAGVSLNAHDTLAVLMNIVADIFKADACSLYLYNTDKDSFEFAMAHGIEAADISSLITAPGEGICGWVFKNQEPLFSNDVTDDNRFDDIINLEFNFNTYGIVASPIILRGKWLGIVEVINWRSSSNFTLKEMKLLTTLSNKIATFVENEQLFDKCCHQLHQRNTMLVLAKEINTSRKLTDLLNYIVITGAELLNSEASSLLLREDNVLRFEIAYGEKGTEVEKFTVPLGAGVAGSVALSGESTFINQVNADGSGIFKEIDKKSGFITRNLICVPLKVKDRIIGVIEVINRIDKEEFGEDDVSLLEGFANEAAIAIERAQLVEEQIQAERLVTIGRTVAGLAHCIKNLANSLKAGEYIVDKGFRDNKLELIQKGWEITKNGSENIRDLVLDMLTISKKREPEYTTCYLHDIATEVIEIIKEDAKVKNVRIKTEFDRNIGPIKVDRKNIMRCQLNLISNALDACSGRDGIIRLATSKLEDKPFFSFIIKDNGHGISEDDQQKLFQEFFSTKGSKGTGLGLSVTHAIVSEHGGSIKCDSKVGKGTTFTIELPMGL